MGETVQTIVETEQPCINHPKTTTSLQCSKCLAPICVQCAVRTPIGLRCPDCAGMRAGKHGYYVPSVLTQVSASQFLLALGGGLLLALGGGLAWGQWRTAGDLGDWSFWWVLAISIAAGEAVARLTNERRGRWLQIIAGGVVGLAALVALLWTTFHGLQLTTLAQLSPMLRSPFQRELLGLTAPNGVFVLIGMLIAARRLRL